MTTTIASLAIQISANAGQLGAQINQANQSLRRLEETAKSTDNSLNRSGNSLGFLTNRLQAFISVSAGVGALTWAVRQASQAEQAQMAFKTMLGSAEDARDMIAELRDFAAKTPLEFSGLQQNAKTLMQFGVATEDILPILKTLGDISLGDAERMQHLTLAFAQMSAAGRLQGQDLLQMVNAGFNPLQEISEKTGISLIELRKRMEAGAISSNLVTNAFISATAEGGRFSGAMNEMATTLSGKFGKLKEEINGVARAVGEDLSGGLKEAIESISLFMRQSSEGENAIAGSWKMIGDAIGEATKQILYFFRASQAGLLALDTLFVRSLAQTSEMITGVKNESLETAWRSLGQDFLVADQMAKDILNGKKNPQEKNEVADGEEARKAMIDELTVAQKKANDELEKWKNKAGDIARNVDPLIEYTEKVKELQQAMELGGLSQEHYSAALEEAQQALFKATQPERRDRRVTIASAISSGSSEMANFLAEATNRDARRNEQAQALEEQKRQTALLAQAVQLLGETPVLETTDIE